MHPVATLAVTDWKKQVIYIHLLFVMIWCLCVVGKGWSNWGKISLIIKDSVVIIFVLKIESIYSTDVACTKVRPGTGNHFVYSSLVESAIIDPWWSMAANCILSSDNEEDQAESREVREVLSQQSTYVKLNVGGALFTTTIGTLTKYDNMLRAMFSGRMDVQTDEEGETRILLQYLSHYYKLYVVYTLYSSPLFLFILIPYLFQVGC